MDDDYYDYDCDNDDDIAFRNQMMFLHDSNFTILLLRHLCIHEAQPIGNDDDKRDGGRIHRDDGDNDDDDHNEDKEAALVIRSLLLIIFRHRPTEEPVFEHVLGELLKGLVMMLFESLAIAMMILTDLFMNGLLRSLMMIIL